MELEAVMSPVGMNGWEVNAFPPNGKMTEEKLL